MSATNAGLGQAIAVRLAAKSQEVARQQGAAAMSLLEAAANVAKAGPAGQAHQGGHVDVYG